MANKPEITEFKLYDTENNEIVSDYERGEVLTINAFSHSETNIDAIASLSLASPNLTLPNVLTADIFIEDNTLYNNSEQLVQVDYELVVNLMTRAIGTNQRVITGSIQVRPGTEIDIMSLVPETIDGMMVAYEPDSFAITQLKVIEKIKNPVFVKDNGIYNATDEAVDVSYRLIYHPSGSPSAVTAAQTGVYTIAAHSSVSAETLLKAGSYKLDTLTLVNWAIAEEINQEPDDEEEPQPPMVDDGSIIVESNTIRNTTDEPMEVMYAYEYKLYNAPPEIKTTTITIPPGGTVQLEDLIVAGNDYTDESLVVVSWEPAVTETEPEEPIDMSIIKPAYIEDDCVYNPNAFEVDIEYSYSFRPSGAPSNVPTQTETKTATLKTEGHASYIQLVRTGCSYIQGSLSIKNTTLGTGIPLEELVPPGQSEETVQSAYVLEDKIYNPNRAEVAIGYSFEYKPSGAPSNVPTQTVTGTIILDSYQTASYGSLLSAGQIYVPDSLTIISTIYVSAGSGIKLPTAEDPEPIVTPNIPSTDTIVIPEGPYDKADMESVLVVKDTILNQNHFNVDITYAFWYIPANKTFAEKELACETIVVNARKKVSLINLLRQGWTYIPNTLSIIDTMYNSPSNGDEDDEGVEETPSLPQQPSNNSILKAYAADDRIYNPNKFRVSVTYSYQYRVPSAPSNTPATTVTNTVTLSASSFKEYTSLLGANQVYVIGSLSVISTTDVLNEEDTEPIIVSVDNVIIIEDKFKNTNSVPVVLEYKVGYRPSGAPSTTPIQYAKGTYTMNAWECINCSSVLTTGQIYVSGYSFVVSTTAVSTRMMARTMTLNSAMPLSEDGSMTNNLSLASQEGIQINPSDVQEMVYLSEPLIIKNDSTIALSGTDADGGSFDKSVNITFTPYVYYSTTTSSKPNDNAVKLMSEAQFETASTAGKTIHVTKNNYLHLFVSSPNMAVEQYALGAWVQMQFKLSELMLLTQDNGIKQPYYAYTVGPFSSDTDFICRLLRRTENMSNSNGIRTTVSLGEGVKGEYTLVPASSPEGMSSDELCTKKVYYETQEVFQITDGEHIVWAKPYSLTANWDNCQPVGDIQYTPILAERPQSTISVDAAADGVTVFHGDQVSLDYTVAESWNEVAKTPNEDTVLPPTATLTAENRVVRVVNPNNFDCTLHISTDSGFEDTRDMSALKSVLEIAIAEIPGNPQQMSLKFTAEQNVLTTNHIYSFSADDIVAATTVNKTITSNTDLNPLVYDIGGTEEDTVNIESDEISLTLIDLDVEYTVTFTSSPAVTITATAEGKTISSGAKVKGGTAVVFTYTAETNYAFDSSGSATKTLNKVIMGDYTAPQELANYKNFRITKGVGVNTYAIYGSKSTSQPSWETIETNISTDCNIWLSDTWLSLKVSVTDVEAHYRAPADTGLFMGDNTISAILIQHTITISRNNVSAIQYKMGGAQAWATLSGTTLSVTDGLSLEVKATASYSYAFDNLGTNTDTYDFGTVTADDSHTFDPHYRPITVQASVHIAEIKLNPMHQGVIEPGLVKTITSPSVGYSATYWFDASYIQQVSITATGSQGYRISSGTTSAAAWGSSYFIETEVIKFTITISGSNATITAGPTSTTTVDYGGSVSVTATANTGYAYTNTGTVSNTWSYTNITENKTINITPAWRSHTVTIGTGVSSYDIVKQDKNSSGTTTIATGVTTTPKTYWIDPTTTGNLQITVTGVSAGYDIPSEVTTTSWGGTTALTASLHYYTITLSGATSGIASKTYSINGYGSNPWPANGQVSVPYGSSITASATSTSGHAFNSSGSTSTSKSISSVAADGGISLDSATYVSLTINVGSAMSSVSYTPYWKTGTAPSPGTAVAVSNSAGAHVCWIDSTSLAYVVVSGTGSAGYDVSGGGQVDVGSLPGSISILGTIKTFNLYITTSHCTLSSGYSVGNNTVNYGSTHQVTATADSGYYFNDGTTTMTETRSSITSTPAGMTFIANKQKFVITAPAQVTSYSISGRGSSSGSLTTLVTQSVGTHGGTYTHYIDTTANSGLTLSATAKSGYKITGGTGSISPGSTTITVAESVTVLAATVSDDTIKNPNSFSVSVGYSLKYRASSAPSSTPASQKTGTVTISGNGSQSYSSLVPSGYVYVSGSLSVTSTTKA